VLVAEVVECIADPPALNSLLAFRIIACEATSFSISAGPAVALRSMLEPREYTVAGSVMRVDLFDLLVEAELTFDRACGTSSLGCGMTGMEGRLSKDLLRSSSSRAASCLRESSILSFDTWEELTSGVGDPLLILWL